MKKKGILGDQRGVVSYLLLWVYVMAIVIIFFAFSVPFSIEFNTSLYRSAENSFDRAETAANQIQDANIRTSVLQSITDSQDVITSNTENLSKYFQYSWIMIPIIITLIFFIITRRAVEQGVA